MIYFVEDDNSIRELVVYSLNNGGYEAKGFSKPSLFWEALKEELPQLILLDIMLPEEDGLEILKKLRGGEETVGTPIMMLTAKSSEYDKVVGLDYGADDYMQKPFGIMELMARVKALLRRTNASSPKDKEEEAIKLANLYFSPQKHLVKVDDKEVQLTLKEFQLLSYLIFNRGMVLTRDQILTNIWGYGFDGESRTVDVHIRTLRQKLGSGGNLIETVRGIGYRIGEDY